MLPHSTTPHAHVHGAGPALLLAHGAGGSFDDNFGGLVGELRHRRTLLGRDYPGSGSRPVAGAPLQLDDLADELVDTAVSHGLSHFPVLGLSLGSAVAITAALRHPDRVSALVLTVGFPRGDSQLTTFAEQYAVLAADGRVDALARMLVLAESPAVLADRDEQTRSEVLDAMAAGLQQTAALRAPQMELAPRVDLTDRLPGISVPTLVIAAGQDRIVLPGSTRDLARGIPEAELVELPGAGHIFTAPEVVEWAALVAAFLDRHGV
ncbi:alpha/beta fold hydrolase [Luteipulveratus halotolerans]|uniref:AB hydrolase-1 domain-containing protein n=1 Tax=Luteipulveratus halotolerans TaxID=1631356 RepID=A0A0L6CF28_9MICO|nr:alpha/beta fold hydrolase [Luteipulveratus halotolerans]KNX36451.1 hypothetical protein VV01_03670 [Luteipulveratus halotolerans]